MHQPMFSLPLRYGIWHLYKRQFYPLINCLLQSDLKTGDEVPCRKLVYTDKHFGALFLVG